MSFEPAANQPTPEQEPTELLHESDFIAESRRSFIREQLAIYFDFEEELFPETDKSMLGLRRFYRYYTDQIEKQFPIDHPIYRNIHELERSVIRRMSINLFAKRVVLLLGLAALLEDRKIVNAVLGPNASAVSGAFVVVTLAVALFLASFVLLAVLKQFYNNSVNADAAMGNEKISSRLAALSALFGDLLSVIDKRKYDLNDPNKWGAETSWLVRCAIWTAMRISYIEKYIQVRMWRVRRTHRVTIAVSRSTALLMFVVFAALYFRPLPPHSWLPAAPDGIAILSVLAAFGLSVMSVLTFRTPPDDVKKRLSVKRWAGFRVLKMQEKLAQHIEKDKNNIWNAELNRKPT
jgi:hypothetical protein